MTKSLNTFIRNEKARIRREILNTQGQLAAISELYKKYKPVKVNDNPGNIPARNK